MPDDPSCYIDGKVRYDLIREREWFGRGIDRLEAGFKAGHRIAIMCSELEPHRCHRSKLVGEALVARKIPIGHIDEDGTVITQQAVLSRLSGGQGALFDLGYTSRKKYKPGGDDDQEVA